jgi:hypothetical protein
MEGYTKIQFKIQRQSSIPNQNSSHKNQRKNYTFGIPIVRKKWSAPSQKWAHQLLKNKELGDRRSNDWSETGRALRVN